MNLSIFGPDVWLPVAYQLDMGFGVYRVARDFAGARWEAAHRLALGGTWQVIDDDANSLEEARSACEAHYLGMLDALAAEPMDVSL
jgi:hypothetical protein